MDNITEVMYKWSKEFPKYGTTSLPVSITVHFSVTLPAIIDPFN